MEQLELIPLATIPIKPHWVKTSTGSIAVWELCHGVQPTGWTLNNSRRIYYALYPWHLVHADGRTIKPSYAMGWKTADEARSAGLRAHQGTLQLYPASMIPWKTQGRPLTDSGHDIKDVYLIGEPC